MPWSCISIVSPTVLQREKYIYVCMYVYVYTCIEVYIIKLHYHAGPVLCVGVGWWLGNLKQCLP